MHGGDGADTLIGGTGNDTLVGWLGNDIYVFNRGDGQDTISDFWEYGSSGNDTVLFGTGITAADLVVTQVNSGSGLLLSIAGTTDSVLLNNSVSDGRFRIEQVQFADGSALSHAQLMVLGTQPTSGNDTFYGSYDSEVLQGGAGNDTLSAGLGNDTLIGGTGDDVLIGWEETTPSSSTSATGATRSATIGDMATPGTTRYCSVRASPPTMWS